MDFFLDYNRFLDLREKDKVWKLLKADNAPLILSFLKNMFQTEREIPYDAIKANLNMLLSEFASSNPDLQLKVSARDYLNTWMESGWIKRLLQNDVVMLTDAAQKAIDFADNLDAKMETMRELLESADYNAEWLGFQRLFESNMRKTVYKDE